MQENLLKKGEQLREDVDAMQKHLFRNVDRRDRCDEFSRDTSLNAAYSYRVATPPVPDEVLGQVMRSREARRLARSRRCRKTVRKMDAENKENVCYSQHLPQSDGAAYSKRRRDVLPSPAKFRPVSCSVERKDWPRLSSQFARFFDAVPLLPGPASRGDDSANSALTDRRRVGGPRVPNVVRESRAAAVDDTSVWSAVTHVDNRRPPSTTPSSASCSGSPVLEPELSRISSSSQPELRHEQTSSGDLTGAFHSTFSYPLHSTLLTAAATKVDVSCVPETVPEDHDLEQTDSCNAAPIGSKSASTVSDTVIYTA